MKLYLAGPMSGKKDFNFPEFHRHAKFLRNSGHVVFSPAEHDESKWGVENFKSETGSNQDVKSGWTLREALAADCEFICKEADGIAMMPEWENSKGARAEHALALALNLKIIYL